MAKSKPSIRKIIEAGEEKITELTNQVLDGSKMISNLDKAFEVTRETREKLDKGVQQILNAMNLPTLADLEALSKRIESLNGKLVSLSLKVDRVIARKKEKAAGPAAPAPTSKQKAAEPKKKVASGKGKAKAKTKAKAKGKAKTK